MHGNGNVKEIGKGYVMRPAVSEEAGAVTLLLNACSLEQVGEIEWEEHELANDWQCPTWDLARDARVVVAPDGRLVGYADVWDQPPHVRIYSMGSVHPEYRGRGLGSAMARWLEERANGSLADAPAEARVTLIQFQLANHEPTTAFLSSQGYQTVRYNHRMVMELDGPPPEPVLPAGVVIRPYLPSEVEPLLRATRDEFRDHWGYVETPWEQHLEQFAHWIRTDPDHDPDLWLVAVEGCSGEIVGTSLGRPRLPEDPDMGWINDLGVRRPWRRQGIALALLHRSFGELYRRGKKRVGLGVDASSLTGATRLYERAGMHVARVYAVYEKELQPGVEISTQSVPA
jgi:GNAT superfamily N-acetyltransferase